MTVMMLTPVYWLIDNDGDCDGVLTADDCDDTDLTTTVAEDADCDGILDLPRISAGGEYTCGVDVRV